MGELLTVASWSLGAAAVVVVAVCVAYRRTGRIAVVDTFWGLFFVAIALTCAVVGSGHTGRRWLVAAMVTAWGVRLAWHLHRRSHGAGEDPRYAALVERVPADQLFSTAIRRFFVPQALIAWFVSLPVQVVAVTAPPMDGLVLALAPVGLVGVALWAAGLALESAGDAQLTRFKARRASGQLPADAILDSGVWRWTRHPNYMGDVALWWGLFLVAAAHWPGALTVASPAVMTYLLVVATGAGLLEKSMMSRPGYRAYAARTSGFLPLPSRPAATHTDPVRGALGFPIRPSTR